MGISILGANIKRIREEKGITSSKLSKLARVGGATISEIENGKRQSLQSATISKIATALDVTTDQLLSLGDSEGEFVVIDIEQTIAVILSSDDLQLDGIELTKNEKEQLRVIFNAAVESIRINRNEMKK